MSGWGLSTSFPRKEEEAAHPTLWPSITASKETCPKPTLPVMNGRFPFHCHSGVGDGGFSGGRGIAPPTSRPWLFIPWKGRPLGLRSLCSGGGSRGQQRGQPLLLEVQMKKWHQTTRPTQGEDGQVQQQLRPAKEESAIPPRGGSLMSSGGQKVT